MIKKHWLTIFLLVLSLGSIWPLFRTGFFPMHDDTQVARVYEMAQALKAGQFPVRWVGDLGYGFGYPIFNFYAPLPYYVGAFFNLLGFNPLLATKIMFSLGIILAGISIYLLVKEFFGPLGGLIAALFYLYAPYHALDVYVRGAVGEFWAMASLSLVFLGFYRLYRGRRIGVLVASLAFAAVILSHNLTAMMLMPFILLTGIFMFLSSKNKKFVICCLLLVALLSLGISAFYWLPAISEMWFTKVLSQIGGGADFRDHFVYLDQIWASPWGFAGSAAGRLDGMSFMLGKLHLILALVCLLTLSKPVFLAFGFLLISIFLTTNYSQFIWEAIKPMAFIQYPWRFLALSTFFVSFCAGAVTLRLPKKKVIKWAVSVALILVLLFLNVKYFRPQIYLNLGAKDYINEENLKWRTSKISDEYLPKDFPVPQNSNEVAWEKIELIKGMGEVKNLAIKPHQYSFEVSAQTDSEILVNLAYFPGWKLWINGKETKPILDSGRIRLPLPAGSHKVLLKLTDTPIRTIANLVSLISLFGCIFLIYKWRV